MKRYFIVFFSGQLFTGQSIRGTGSQITKDVFINQKSFSDAMCKLHSLEWCRITGFSEVSEKEHDEWNAE